MKKLLNKINIYLCIMILAYIIVSVTLLFMNYSNKNVNKSGTDTPYSNTECCSCCSSNVEICIAACCKCK
jgi:hypothetical protein